MPKEEDRLANEKTWDFNSAERRGPVAGRRAIVSVGIPSDELGLISTAARQSQMKVSEFIRGAAIEKARESLGVWSTTRTMSMSDSARTETPETETLVNVLLLDSVLLRT